ncbi:hypothetical protein CC78DRAFT_613175 [Lojkania enalia]|uniref:Uncharacterized protein n=1 Tax=Lojkania enalia TaxID=147567 RepID=A0A9P4N891_9PLEO|nr:hypothetical protein CC78DRAFT_613175 [Didymosphaeria enalia]
MIRELQCDSACSSSEAVGNATVEKLPGTREKKALEKPRHERHLRFRADRRCLESIDLSNSHLQEQSPLFSVLPPEIRNVIFEYAVCQYVDYSSPINLRSGICHIGHEHHLAIDTNLLRTCRLIYYETHAIPIRSTTYHIRSLQTRMSDHRLHHISSQQGQHLYHLHDMCVRPDSTQLSRFIRSPHLQWKRISYTIWSGLNTPWTTSSLTMLLNTLEGVKFPASCQEVNVELETVEEDQQHVVFAHNQQLIWGSSLLRTDASSMQYSPEGSREFVWLEPARQVHRSIVPQFNYYTYRLCWRAAGSMREWEVYDHVDCLERGSRTVVSKIASLPSTTAATEHNHLNSGPAKAVSIGSDYDRA